MHLFEMSCRRNARALAPVALALLGAMCQYWSISCHLISLSGTCLLQAWLDRHWILPSVVAAGRMRQALAGRRLFLSSGPGQLGELHGT